MTSSYSVATPRVATVILNWRRPNDTVACVRSVAKSNHGAVDIIVCDNDSQDGSLEAIAAGVAADLPAINAARAASGNSAYRLHQLAAGDPLPAADGGVRLIVMPTGRNGGYAFGNNIGIRLALTDPEIAHVFILNNDTEVDPAAVTHLLAKMAAEPDIGLCGCQVLYLGDHTVVQALGGARFLPSRARGEQIGMGLEPGALPDERTVEAQLDYVNGAAAFARRSMLEHAGLMDEGYFLYWEEIDWADQIRRAGFRLGYCAAAIVRHRVGASTGADDAGDVSPTFAYYMSRNRFRFLARKRPALLLVAVPLFARDVIREVARRRPALAGAMLRGALATFRRV